MTQEPPIVFKPIGVIHTPYQAGRFAPSQPLEREEGEARIELEPEYAEALADLASFSHVILIYHLNHAQGWKPKATPPWAKGKTVGLFASRSPHRPNPVGISIVELRKIESNVIFTSALDVFDHTPLIDIKPYIRDLDAKPQANQGWIEQLEDHEHIMGHLRGIPHDHGHHHKEEHQHGHHEHQDDHERHEHRHGHHHDDDHHH
jgi:tRNA-Thr(GGU) m(6)t(6)A37 methyltransferase TsaA